ncbi:MAG: glycerol-3-phosphate responsive antiterminator [Bacillota bacterium]
MRHLKHYFAENPVIAALRDKDDLNQALGSSAIALFILSGEISDLPEMMKKTRENDKLLFLHIDLINGIASDRAGINYLAQNNLCDGIVTTRSKLIREAQKFDLMAVQRLFLLDSAALESGEKMIKNNDPDAIEILPGIAAPYFIDHVSTAGDCPVIAGGLIRHRKEIEELLSAGVMAISSSDSHLW